MRSNATPPVPPQLPETTDAAAWIIPNWSPQLEQPSSDVIENHASIECGLRVESPLGPLSILRQHPTSCEMLSRPLAAFEIQTPPRTGTVARSLDGISLTADQIDSLFQMQVQSATNTTRVVLPEKGFS